jgi:hypothetical protein
VGDNLATFLANRLSMSFTNLNCGNYGLKEPVTVTVDGNGVATGAAYSLTQQAATGAASTAVDPGAGQTTGTQSQGDRRRFFQNPSGA